jgi:serine/threonine protein kinase
MRVAILGAGGTIAPGATYSCSFTETVSGNAGHSETDTATAKVTDDEGLSLSNDLVGTVRYMAPERFEGRCDARSDVYALGVLTYELLTGVKPHTGDTPIQVAYKHVHDDVPPPSSVRTREYPAVCARSAAPRVPAAGPLSMVVIGWLATSRAEMTPPFDFMM